MITTAKRETFFATDSPITLSPAPGQYYKHVDLTKSPSPWLEKQEKAVKHAALLERATEEGLQKTFLEHQEGAKRRTSSVRGSMQFLVSDFNHWSAVIEAFDRSSNPFTRFFESLGLC